MSDSVNDYWEARQDFLYYQVTRILIAHIGKTAKSIIDVGSAGCPYLDWFDFIPIRTSVDLRHPYEAEGVRSFKSDLLTWEPDQRYDVVTCLQVMEHVPAAAEFAQRLLSLGDTLIVSVPYKWPHGRVKSHVHDPVDEAKLLTWFGRPPNFEFVCREVKAQAERIIQVYDVMPEPWSSLNRRDALLRDIRLSGENVTRKGDTVSRRHVERLQPLTELAAEIARLERRRATKKKPQRVRPPVSV